MRLRVVVCLSVCFVAALAVTCWADEGPPDPISLDRQSPSVMGFGELPGNIYDMMWTGPMPPAPPMGWDVGGPGPILHVGAWNYVMTPMDNTDGLSNGEMPPPDYPFWSVYFSGDDMSQGLPQTDYRHQANRRQAAGDRFVVNGVTQFSPVAVMQGAGPSWIAGPMYPGGLWNFPINLLSANQHRYNEIPSIGPAAMNTYVPPFAGATQMDDMDALELTPLDRDGDQIHDTPIYFSLDRMSPTLGMMGATAADILVAPPGGPVMGIFAPFWSMGLTPDDDIDALAVWDYGNPLYGDPGIDYALFSLAPGSPYLMMTGRSPADIFVTDFSGFVGGPGNMLYLPFFMLGMGPEDNVDALDVEYVEQGGHIEEPLDWVAGAIVPGDYNGDGVIDAADYTVWSDNRGMMGMPGIPGDGDDGSMTGNPDGVVNEFDFLWWKMNFNAVGYGAGALAAAVPEPASVTLAALALAAFIAAAVARRK